MATSPVQSRLAASLVASMPILLASTWLLVPQFALAEELIAQLFLGDPHEYNNLISPAYEPDFSLFDRSLIGRAPPGITPLENNVPTLLNLKPGSIACYVVPKSVVLSNSNNTEAQNGPDEVSDDGNLQARGARQDGDSLRAVYLSANTCLQPYQSDPKSQDKTAPQLTLLASTSSEIGCPKNKKDVGEDLWVDFDEGISMLSVPSANDLYVTILAPALPKGFQGVYNFELVASVNDFYHKLYTTEDNIPELLWMDSDSSAALLTTRNLTAPSEDPTKNDEDSEKWVSEHKPPFKLYVENKDFSVFDGIRHSVCALKSLALIEASMQGGRSSKLVTTELTTRGAGGLPKQQFYFEGLNSSSTYNAILVKTVSAANDLFKRQDQEAGGGNIAGATTIYEGIEFRTVRGSSCKVVTDLDFCTDVQYAVPGNDRFNGTELAGIYDKYARDTYAAFEKVMMQIPCETDSTSKYSLARDCGDCKVAYKRWLCTVAIPRCEDYTSDNMFTVIRNAGQPFPNGTMLPEEERRPLMQKTYHNSSRNRFIDDEIKPGPYREVLPCEDICYEVVQSCPAAIGFSCPRPGYYGFSASYGVRNLSSDLSDPNQVVCNYPGEPRTRMSGAMPLYAIQRPVAAITLVAIWAVLL